MTTTEDMNRIALTHTLLAIREHERTQLAASASKPRLSIPAACISLARGTTGLSKNSGSRQLAADPKERT